MRSGVGDWNAGRIRSRRLLARLINFCRLVDFLSTFADFALCSRLRNIWRRWLRLDGRGGVICPRTRSSSAVSLG